MLEDLIIHLPCTTVGFIMQRVAVRTEAGHIACAHIAVVLLLRDKRFAGLHIFLCKVIIPACKHAAVIHLGCRADNLTRFRINLFIDDLALHGRVILHRCFALRIERNTAKRIGVGCVGDRHMFDLSPLRVEGDLISVPDLFSLIGRHILKERTVTIDLSRSVGRLFLIGIFRPAVELIACLAKGIFRQISRTVGTSEGLIAHTSLAAVRIETYGKRIRFKHGDIAHLEHGRSVLRERVLHHVGRNSQRRDLTHRRQSALFIPADKMPTRLWFSSGYNIAACNGTARHCEAAATGTHGAALSRCGVKLHSRCAHRLVDGVKRHVMAAIFRDLKRLIVDHRAGALRLDGV